MRFFSPWFIERWLYREAIFRIKTNEKIVYLTFDDGPDPVSTPALLKILARNNVKATFFCSGNAAEKNPDLISRILSEGHIIGNHSYSHLNGWKTSDELYISEVEKAAVVTSQTLFRPPYGKLTLRQYNKLKRRFRIVFWDIMPYDFDRSFGAENCLKVLKRKIRPGSVIVLHDMEGSVVVDFLENFLIFSRSEGYRFNSISL
jgi:peptidoglycan-N-acetylglucosamine deacetylase